MDRNFDGVAVPGKRFVDRVIYDFVNQVVQSDLARRSDIHRGALAHRIASLKDGYRR
jgi:hypothetical protein